MVPFHPFPARLYGILDAEFLADILGDSLLVDEDVHRLVGYVCLGGVENA